SKLFATFASLGELAVALVKDLLVAAVELDLGGDVADGAVQANGVVMGDVVRDDPSRVVDRERYQDTNALAFDGFVPAFDFTVALGIIRRGLDVSHAGDANKLLEVLGNELGSVVANDAWPGVGVGFAGALDDGFHVGFLHFRADFPMHDEAAAAIEDAAEEVKRPGDVEVTDIDVPVFVGFEGLNKAGAFLGKVGRRPGQESRDFEDAVDAGRAAGDDIGIEHHKGQAAVPFKGMLAGEGPNLFLFVVGEPVVAGHP